MNVWALLLIVSAPVLCQDDESCLLGGDQNSTSFYLQATAIANSSTSFELFDCPEDAEGDNYTCLADPQGNLPCMCGEKLTQRQDVVRDRMRKRCSNSRTSDIASPLGFCQSAFVGLGYNVTMVASDAQIPALTLYSDCSLGEAMSDLRRTEEIFSAILNRTIVGIYLESEEQRCACREAYQQWLCATKLRLYRVPSPSDSEPCACCNLSSRVGEVEGGETIQRFRPCLSVCHRVLQMCPYYLPSNFQPNRSPNASNMTYLEQIYGGYPAFDCPREDILMGYCMNCSASLNGNASLSADDVPTCSSSYAFPNSSYCLGRPDCKKGGERSGAASGPVGSWAVLTLTSILCVPLLFAV